MASAAQCGALGAPQVAAQAARRQKRLPARGRLEQARTHDAPSTLPDAGPDHTLHRPALRAADHTARRGVRDALFAVPFNARSAQNTRGVGERSDSAAPHSSSAAPSCRQHVAGLGGGIPGRLHGRCLFQPALLARDRHIAVSVAPNAQRGSDTTAMSRMRNGFIASPVYAESRAGYSCRGILSAVR